MSSVIGVIGIILAIAIMIILPMKKFNIVLVSIIATLVLCLTSWMNLAETWDGAIGVVGMLMGMMAPLFIFGAILGEIYCHSNAAMTIAKIVIAPFKNTENEAIKVAGSLVLLMIFRSILGFAGFDNLAIMPLLIVLFSVVFSQMNIPRKYIPCLLLICGEIQYLTPGAPGTEVVLLEQFFEGFKSSDHMVIRFIILLIYIAGATYILTRMVKKDHINGIGFEAGKMVVPEIDENQKCPNIILTLIPLVVVWVMFSFVGLPAWLSLLIGVVTALICLGPYIENLPNLGKLATLRECCNSGVYKIPVGLLMCMLFSNAMTLSPYFSKVTDFLGSMPIPTAFGLLIASILLVTATGSTSGVIPVAAALAAQIYMPQGMTSTSCALIVLCALTVLDTLPNNFGLHMQCGLTDSTVEEAYPSVFRTTVLLSAGICVIVALLAMTGILN